MLVMYPALAADSVQLVRDINRTIRIAPAGATTSTQQFGGQTLAGLCGDDTCGLWSVSSEPESARMIKQMPSSQFVERIQAAADRVFFLSGFGNVGDAWVTDGTPEGTAPITAVTNVEIARPFAILGSDAYFANTHRELWKSHGTAAGTLKLADDAFSPVTLGSVVLFCRQSLQTGVSELWRTDGTPGGTVLVSSPGGIAFSDSIKDLVVSGDRAYFSVWGSDGLKLW